MELLDPKLDLVFKLLLSRDDDLLKSMIEAVLQLPAPIESLEVLNPGLPGDLSSDKLVVLDVRVRLSTGVLVDIEMQTRKHTGLENRLVYYWAKLYAGQLDRGDGYNKLHPAYVVAWINAQMFADDRFHGIFELKDLHREQPLSSHLAIHTLEIPKLNIKDTTTPIALLRWARFFVAKTRRDFDRLAAEDSVMERAVKKLESLSVDPETRELAEERERNLVAYHHSMDESHRLGVEKGLEKGRAQGREETRTQMLASYLESRFNADATLLAVVHTIEPDTLARLTPRLFAASNLNEVEQLLRANAEDSE